VQISAVGDCRSASQSASDFFTQGQPRSRQGKARHVMSWQSRAERNRAWYVWLAWRAVIMDYFWKQSLLHEAPRACGEWLDLAPRPLLLLLACFSFHRCSCSCSCSTLVFVCCCCCCCDLWSHDSFLDRGAYLIHEFPPAHIQSSPGRRSHRRQAHHGCPSGQLSSWASWL
jgi:hypothetical protein